MKIYKVRRKSDGLFLQKRPGGHRWTKQGSMWSQYGHLKLASLNGVLRKIDLRGLETIEYEIVEKTHWPAVWLKNKKY